MRKLKGLIAAAFTPFKGDVLNLDIIPEYAKYLDDNEVAGVFVNGTTGESLSLTVDERLEIAEAWLNCGIPNLKIIVHVGHNSLPECRELAAHAQGKGAWAISAMAPMFFRPDLLGLIDYSAQIAASAPEIPFYYYHMPSMTGASFLMLDFLKQAEAEIPNLAGIKFTYENLMDFKLCMDFAGGKYDMVFGRDEILLCGLSLGAEAGIGSTYNFAAPLYQGMVNAFLNGNQEKARELQNISMKIVEQCLRAAPVAPLVALRALTSRALGLDLGRARAPLIPMSDKVLDKLFSAIQMIESQT